MPDASKVVAVIPARFESARFPGKVLAAETGQPLIQHVYEQALRAEQVGRVVVATDDRRIYEAVVGFGGECLMTRRNHANGTSRIGEVAAELEHELVVNVQGDEPELPPELIDLAVEALRRDGECVAGTVGSPFGKDEDPRNPNIVKVVRDVRGRALYFSRSLIPFVREESGVRSQDSGGGERKVHPGMLKHVGLYVYRREFLAQYGQLPPTPLEKAEKLEQLRILEHGYAMVVAIGETHHHGIDTPEQYAAFVKRWREGR